MDATTTAKRQNSNPLTLIIGATVLVAGVLVLSGTVPLLSPEIIHQHPYLAALAMPLFLMRRLKPFLSLRGSSKRHRRTAAASADSVQTSTTSAEVAAAPGFESASSRG